MSVSNSSPSGAGWALFKNNAKALAATLIVLLARVSYSHMKMPASVFLTLLSSR